MPSTTLEHEHIEHIGHVLVHECPDRTVDAGKLAPTADVHRRGKRYHADHEQGLQQHHPPKGSVYLVVQVDASGVVEEANAYHGAEHYHGVQADDASLGEVGNRHAFPAVVVRIAHHEATEGEEEVYGQVAVRHIHGEQVAGIALEQMIQYHDDGGYATKSVQYLVPRLTLQIMCHNASMFTDYANIADYRLSNKRKSPLPGGATDFSLSELLEEAIIHRSYRT